MKKFDFRLQRVMDVREIKKQERARELAASQRELEQQERRLQEATAECKESRDGLRQALKKRSSAGLLASLERWRHRREEEAQHQERRTTEQRLVVHERRESLILAAKEKETLVRLKDHAREEYRTDCQREEQAFLDELGCKIGRVWKYYRPDKMTE